MRDFKYYSEPFDRAKPPPSPPNREICMWFGETKESLKRTAEYRWRLNEHFFDRWRDEILETADKLKG